MEDSQLERRRYRDKFIQVLLGPIFETASFVHQQEFFRATATKLGMEPLQFNGFLRQVWQKNSPAPQLVDLPEPVQSPHKDLPLSPGIVNAQPTFTPSVTSLSPQQDTPLSPTGYRKPSGGPKTTSPQAWMETFLKIVNGDIFSTVPEYQRQEYLVREYNTALRIGAIRTVADFNQLLVQNWKNNAPEIPQLSSDTLRYVTVKNIFYKPMAPRRTDVTYVGDKEFINLSRVRDQVLAFAKTVQARLEQERKKQLEISGDARGWPMESELMTLIDDINLVVREMWYREGQYYSMTIPLNEYVTTMQNWTDRYNDIVKELGKRRSSINTHDLIDMTPVDEIPDGEYIRLNNGIVWHIMSLVDYIREFTNGRNTSAGLSSYPTGTLWNKEIDLPRILRHPLVRGTEFAKWLVQRQSPKAMADNIDVETLNRMERAGGLLRSVGPDFINEARSRLTLIQQEAFVREARSDPEDLGRIRDSKLREEVQVVIKQDIKSIAMIEWVEYWKTMSQLERDSIITFNPKLEENVEKCIVDKFCVFGMGNDFLVTRNEIADAKGIPTKNYGVSFE